MPLVTFYNPWKYQETSLSGGYRKWPVAWIELTTNTFRKIKIMLVNFKDSFESKESKSRKYGNSYIWYSSANKGWSAVNYRQSLAFERPYLQCNDHCDRWRFQEIFFYFYYFLEIILTDLELVFLEFNHFYKPHRTSLFSFYLFIFYSLFRNHSVY